VGIRGRAGAARLRPYGFRKPQWPSSTLILTFTDEEGHTRQFTWRTIQTWLTRYKKHGEGPKGVRF
jgi:hypothetical protein